MNNHRSISEKIEQVTEWGGIPAKIVLLGISVVSLVLSFIFSAKSGIFQNFDPAWIAVVLCGFPIAIEALTGLIFRFDIKADFLVFLALIASLIIGEVFSAGEVAFIMQLGELLECLITEKAKRNLSCLHELIPSDIQIERNGIRQTVHPKDARIGDIVTVRPGERIGVDGEIISGISSVDQSVITGESLPCDVKTGDRVFAGSLNQFGSLQVRVTCDGKDSSLQRMADLVESADAGKAKVVRLADKIATFIVIGALLAAVAVYLITGEFVRSVTVLVVFCPCSLILATPTAIIAAIANAARRGILIRDGNAAERMARIEKIAFDKTGTLTNGKPKLVGIIGFFPETYSENELLYRTARVEQCSEHPLARAIVEAYTDGGKQLTPVDGFTMRPGLGVFATVDDCKWYIGNADWLSHNGFHIPGNAKESADSEISLGRSVMYVAAEGFTDCIGLLSLSDTVRDDAEDAVCKIRYAGIPTVLLSGDSQAAVDTVASNLRIGESFGDMKPENKLAYVSDKNRKVCMVGDGINDTPALSSAYVGIAMGGIGSGMVYDCADIILVSDSLLSIPFLYRLSKRMSRIILANIILSMTINVVGIILSAFGILSPITGALLHNGGSVFVILHSALLYFVKDRK